MTFQFDTSGTVVDAIGAHGHTKGHLLAWSDLSPFVQGYVEALISSIEIDPRGKWPGVTPVSGLEALGFSYLAPETLARIMEDCRTYQHEHGTEFGNTVERGGWFWKERQRGGMPVSFPPLTVALGDSGKVVFP